MPVRPASASVPSPGLTADRFRKRLNESDTLLWNIERDPTLRTTIVAVAVFDRVPDWDRLRDRLLDVSAAIPRLRQRVVAAPMRLANPHWIDDDRFDVDYHLRRAVVPPPGDLDAVLAMAAPMAMAAFDKERPLWEFTLVEGLTGGRAALIEKMHHSVTDGVGGMLLARAIVDDVRNPRRRAASRREGAVVPVPSTSSSRGPSPYLTSIADAMVENARVALSSARLGAAIPRWTASALRDPVHTAAAAVRGVRSVGRMLRPAGAPLSPAMRGRGMSRRLEAFDVSLPEMLAAAHAAGATLNDAFLAAVAEGMRRYHVRHGVTAESLRVTMPVNLRRDDDPVGNNRFTPVRFALPITDEAPVDQMHRLGEIARRWRREPAVPLSDIIAGALNRLPVVATTSLFGTMLKGVDLVATNVPGLTGRAYLAGAEAIAHYAFPPPSGAACGIAFLSHRDRGCVGITIDTAAVHDPDVLRDCVHDGFRAVLAAGSQ
ncbi:wax ester/triacylglycerol synthase domain-containing protein [Desertimonas flava]|uniref:wax ester/triacylglycerol synthase domain-containing protein n=1 Tax=Desertimonas flava TaxID=2064846 RepID=UPI000E357A3E|nr:wax ester/triacylglycerol synthase domain-containing protein [Desertimonas flava]